MWDHPDYMLFITETHDTAFELRHESHEKCHLQGPPTPTLRLMLREARRESHGQVLNGLEFPLGGKVLKPLPRLE